MIISKPCGYPATGSGTAYGESKVVCWNMGADGSWYSCRLGCSAIVSSALTVATDLHGGTDSAVSAGGFQSTSVPLLAACVPSEAMLSSSSIGSDGADSERSSSPGFSSWVFMLLVGASKITPAIPRRWWGMKWPRRMSAYDGCPDPAIHMGLREGFSNDDGDSAESSWEGLTTEEGAASL